jgi:hypothetical protein
MMEKVYCVNNYWDMTILEGIAECNGKKYYYNCIFSDKIDDWTDIYELTLLDNRIFKFALENWDYWKNWLEKFYMSIPHPAEYAERRKLQALEEIFIGKNIEKNAIRLTEKYYQNEIKFNEYINNHKPIYKAKGTFSGKINGMDTKVEWEHLIKID